MLKPTSKPFRVFLFSFFACLSICFIAVVPIFISQEKQTVVADTPYASAPYKNISTTLLLSIKDAPVDFVIEISTASGCRITCFPKAAVKNSTEHLHDNSNEYEKARFLGKTADRKISANTDTVIRLVNKLGGITCDTPYGLPAPSGNNNTIALDEKLHFYGSSVAEMLLCENEPNYEKMCFYAKLIGIITAKFLNQANTENYILLNSLSSTDISYKDYYDNCGALTAASCNITAESCMGVWINGKYYIH